MACVEDKTVQRAVVMILERIYEVDLGVTAIPPSGGGLVEGRLFALDAVFDEAIPLAV